MKKWFLTSMCLMLIPAVAFAANDKKPVAKADAKKAPAKAAKKAPAKPMPLYTLDTPALNIPKGKTQLGQILGSLSLRVCVRTDVPPFGYFMKGSLTGFDVALANEIATRIGIMFKKNLVVSYVPISAKQRVSALQNNRCDFVAAAFTYTAKRAKKVAFSKRYLKTDRVVVAMSKITRKKPVIALVKGTKAPKGLKGVEKSYNDYREIIFAMEAGEVDYFVTDRPIALHMIRNVTKSYKITKTLKGTDEYGIGVNKSNKALLQAINIALQETAASGRLAHLLRQWL